MAVAIRIPTVLRAHVDGQATVSAEGATVGEVFTDLVARFPALKNQLIGDDGAIHKFVNVYVDDEDVRYLEGLETKVPDGAQISVLPAVAGG